MNTSASRGRHLSQLGRHPSVVLVSLIGSILTIATFFGMRYHVKVSQPVVEAQRHIVEQDKRSEPTTTEIRFSPVSFQELMSYVYQEVHTDIQREDFLDRHLGRRVTWEGWVGGVYDERGKGISVLIGAAENASDQVAFLNFPQADRSQLASVGFGEKVRFTCTFEKFDARAHLKDCELVKVWPK